MEGIELCKAVEEARELVGARLARVHQLGEVLFLRTFHPSGALVLDPEGKAFHRTALRPPTPPRPPAFAQGLRRLRGQKLLALEQGGYDRTVRLCFPDGDILLDLRPRRGNVFFLGRDGRRAALHEGDPKPLPGEGSDPLAGLGPGLRRAAEAVFGHPPTVEELCSFTSDLLLRDPAGYLYGIEGGTTASFFPRPELGEPLETFPKFWQSLDRVLEERLARRGARVQLEGVKRAIRRRERALAAIVRAEEEAQGWPDIQVQADLILARLSQIPGGVAEVEVEGFDGAPVRLVLDPALSPLWNAQLLYRRAGKLRRRLTQIPARRRELGEELARLRELFDMLRARPELSPYLEEDLLRLGVLAPERVPVALEGRPRELGMGGLLVLVGRSARENDALLRAAHPNDVWLHARGVPGAHVVIRTGGRAVPPEVLEGAARLAAWHSRARGERRVPVSYTEVRHLKKPKGAAPGTVVLKREEVIVVLGEEPKWTH